MITYRLVKKEDWSSIIKLTNDVFKEKIPMEVSFPLLFNEANTFSYVAILDEKVIGFIGVVPEELYHQGDIFYGSRIGAVCISEDHQGQGIGRSLFRLMKKESDNDFLLVSGQGKLYLQEGCEFFGEFNEFIIPEKNSNLVMREYTGEREELKEIHKLNIGGDTYYMKSSTELSILINARALGNLWEGEEKLLLIYENEIIVGFLLISTRHENQKIITEVLEYHGQEEILLRAFRQIAVTAAELRVRAYNESLLSNMLEEISKITPVKNAGTILINEEKVREIPIPHTWDLGFL